MLGLNKYLVWKIVGYMDYYSVVRLSKSCKRMHELLSSTVWYRDNRNIIRFPKELHQWVTDRAIQLDDYEMYTRVNSRWTIQSLVARGARSIINNMLKHDNITKHFENIIVDGKLYTKLCGIDIKISEAYHLVNYICGKHINQITVFDYIKCCKPNHKIVTALAKRWVRKNNIDSLDEGQKYVCLFSGLPEVISHIDDSYKSPPNLLKIDSPIYIRMLAKIKRPIVEFRIAIANEYINTAIECIKLGLVVDVKWYNISYGVMNYLVQSGGWQHTRAPVNVVFNRLFWGGYYQSAIDFAAKYRLPISPLNIIMAIEYDFPIPPCQFKINADHCTSPKVIDKLHEAGLLDVTQISNTPRRLDITYCLAKYIRPDQLPPNVDHDLLVATYAENKTQPQISIFHIHPHTRIRYYKWIVTHGVQCIVTTTSIEERYLALAKLNLVPI
jgi:hypothetical protein